MISLSISKKKIAKDKNNEVTSEKLFKPRRCKDKYGNWRFHEDGIFSREIFGNLNSCFCGANKVDGTWCKICGGRVVTEENMPDFYISLGVEVPVLNANFSVFGKKSSSIKKLANYEAFYYEGEIINFDLNVLNLEEYEDEKIKIGPQAIIAYSNLSEPETLLWIYENTIENMPIPHPIFRPIISGSGGKHIVGSINTMLVDLLSDIKRFLSFERVENLRKFHELSIKNVLCSKYHQVIEEIFKIFTNGKKSIIKKEIISQSITGAIRAVLTNDHSLDEDYISIGYELISTLFPSLAKKHGDNYASLNEELESEEYYVLVNRPPTIGQKSVLGMRPIVSTDPKKRFVIGTNSIIYDGLAGDTDGDVLLVVGLYSEEASRDAERMLPSNNYIGAENGKVRNKMPEDFEYTMKRIYMKNPSERAKIQKTIYDKKYIEKSNLSESEQWERDLKEMDNISRAKYMKIFRAVGRNIWQYCEAPTVEDIAKFLEGEVSEELDNITDFLKNKEKLMNLISRDSSVYSQEESDKHISKVMSSNATDISDSGYFYKKLISSCDDIKIVDTDCGSEGELFDIENITEDIYNYKIRFLYVMEIHNYAEMQFEDFMMLVKSFRSIKIRNPLNCKHASHRGLCEKCAGKIKLNNNNSFIPKNIGIFSTLMVTEHATQASLDSMNNGVSENLNVAIESSMDKKKMEWEEVQSSIKSVCDKIGWIGVQERFYQIAMLSRFYKKGDFYTASSLQHSFVRHSDALGAFIYSSSMNNLIRFINKGTVDLTSMKSKIMFDIYED